MSSRPFSAVDVMLRELERSHGLLDIRFDGWCAWVLVRWTVAMQLAKLPVSAPRGHLTRGQRIAFALRDIRGWLRLPRRRVLAQTYSSALLESEAGRFKDIWLDDLLRQLDSTLKIELLNSAQYLARSRAALQPRHMSTALLDLVCSLLCRVNRSKAAAGAAALMHSILAAGLSNEAPSAAAIETALNGFYWRKRLWLRALKRVAPSVVLLADPGDFALVAAARELGAKVMEMQHGIVDRYNPAYSWSAAALPFRSGMPIPDVLLLHGEHWRRELDANGFWGQSLRVVGNPRVELYRAQRTSKSAQTGRRLAVFTSQGILKEQTTQFLARAFSAFTESPVELIVKLHPVYDDAAGPEWKALSDRPVRVIAGSQEPSTMKLLTSADFHISISSATHYDAIALGVPTIVLGLAGHETVMPLVEARHALFAADPQQLAALLGGDAPIIMDKRVSEYYCEPDAVAKMLREVSRASAMSGQE